MLVRTEMLQRVSKRSMPHLVPLQSSHEFGARGRCDVLTSYRSMTLWEHRQNSCPIPCSLCTIYISLLCSIELVSERKVNNASLNRYARLLCWCFPLTWNSSASTCRAVSTDSGRAWIMISATFISFNSTTAWFEFHTGKKSSLLANRKKLDLVNDTLKDTHAHIDI